MNYAIVSAELDEFPHLNEEWRSRIREAYEAAPYFYPDDVNEYFDSPAWRAWRAAQGAYLNPPSYNTDTHYVSLSEAAGYSSVVTKSGIVLALRRGAEMVRGER